MLGFFRGLGIIFIIESLKHFGQELSIRKEFSKYVNRISPFLEIHFNIRGGTNLIESRILFLDIGNTQVVILATSLLFSIKFLGTLQFR